MTATVEKREGFTTVTPYISVVDVERLIQFMKDAFGAVETGRTKHGSGGLHCEIRLGDSMLMCGNAQPGNERHAALHYHVPNVDQVYAQALQSGAESITPPEDTPYGSRNCRVKDPTGNRWIIATHNGPLTEGMRAVTPFLIHRNAAPGWN